MVANLQIGPRFVRHDKDGLRPFQKETLESLKSDERVVFVEAPVGAGKSYIIRNIIEDDFFKRKPVILTYPTKILMEAQVGALSKEIKDISIWPYSEPQQGAVNVFYYSSSSLIYYLLQQPENLDLQKSELINKLVREFSLLSKKTVIITSPDVLHLLVNLKAYDNSKRIQTMLNGAYIFFDEFHLYSNLANFSKLIKNLLKGMAAKVVFLSATPYLHPEMEEVISDYKQKTISFDSSIGKDGEDRTFNYPLDLEICSFKYTNIELSFQKLKEIIPSAVKPMAIIFDSVFRLKRLKRRLESAIGVDYKIVEWSGFRKDRNIALDDRTIVLGTSSIEVGIDMDFKTLITEVSYWTSAIQRIGRVGRKSDGKVILFTNKNFSPCIQDKRSFDRSVFEKDILQKALGDPTDRLITGEMFRGDSFNFIVYDSETGEINDYNESIFAMFAIEDVVDDWRCLDFRDKEDVLKDLGVGSQKIKSLLLQDKIFPFWGVVKGRLKPYYSRVHAKYSRDAGELLIELKDGGDSYNFYEI